ncbi:uncharacterized protein TrAtP1_000135 [Trichoderma atroviride]|uniref:uncharacterized protein n=1 Tax=Hypocrea atroviridis TaxID=63577 RepID=UPI00331D7ADE|nr:hypothetical protein TrAtP1_000135 [Trichoderma atroviride]
MHPWRDSGSLMLDPVLYAPADIISSVAGSHETLLPEVAGLIGGHLQPNHPLLRFCKVMQLARYLSLAEPGDSVTYPLCEVLSWSRGTLPILAEGQAINRRMRLTIDSRGIKSIDMVSEKSEESAVIGSSRSSHAYIVGSVESLSGVGIEFQVSLFFYEFRIPANQALSSSSE